MLTILICDDDIDFITTLQDKIVNVCKNNKIEYELKHYLSPIEVIKDNAISDANVIFLDINMPDVNGFEFAKQLKDVNIHIIFVTNRDELVFQSMKYHPFYFIRKNHIDEELESQVIEIDKVIKKLSTKILFIDTPNGKSRIEIDRIIYIENIKNYVNIHLIDSKIIITRKSMKVVENDLSNYGFIRVQAGYIINIRYLQNFNRKEITMVNNKIIPISRSKFKLVKERIMEELHDD